MSNAGRKHHTPNPRINRRATLTRTRQQRRRVIPVWPSNRNSHSNSLSTSNRNSHSNSNSNSHSNSNRNSLSTSNSNKYPLRPKRCTKNTQRRCIPPTRVPNQLSNTNNTQAANRANIQAANRANIQAASRANTQAANRANTQVVSRVFPTTTNHHMVHKPAINLQVPHPATRPAKLVGATRQRKV